MTTDQINEFIRQNHTTMSYAEIGAACGLSNNAVGKRYRSLKERGLLDPSKPLVAAVAEPVQKSREDLVQETKLALLQKQMKSEERADAEKEARHQMLLDTIRESITPLEFDYVYTAPTDPEDGLPDEEAAVLVLSDLHFGKRTGSFDMQIAEERFNKLVDGFIKIVSLHRKAYPVNELHIFMTGDIVDGEAIYPTQPHHTDTHVVNQIMRSLRFVAARFAELATMFNKVFVHSVRGNHGRLSKFAHETANFDYLYALVLEQALTLVPNITFNTPETWQQIIDVKGTKILQYHGHQIKMTMNLPWYGITTRVSRWAATEKLADFDVALQGHFHASSRVRWNDKIIFTNGTLVSGDEFALEFLGLESSECQWCFGVHPRRGVTWNYELYPN